MPLILAIHKAPKTVLALSLLPLFLVLYLGFSFEFNFSSHVFLFCSSLGLIIYTQGNFCLKYLQKHPKAIQKISLMNASQIILETRENKKYRAELSPHTYIGSWLIVLVFKNTTKHRYCLLTREALGGGEFAYRKLSAWLYNLSL
ncbi:MAG: hypothetical protein ACKOAD_08675 [Gammaproteobacteria bacterium]